MSQSPSSDQEPRERRTNPDLEPRERRPNLQQHYKPVGIGAITAAALCKSPRRGGHGDSADVVHRR